MERAGLTLLLLAGLALPFLAVAPAMLFVSWGACALGLALLRLVPDRERAASYGLWALAILVTLALLGGSVTVGIVDGDALTVGGVAVAQVVLNAGFAAAWIAPGVYLAADVRHGRVARVGLSLGALGFVALLMEEATRDRSWRLGVALLWAGLALVAFAYAQAVRRAWSRRPSS